MIFVCLSKAVEADKPRLPVTITSPLARDVRANPSSLRGLCENSISCHSCSVMIPAARYRCRWQQLGTELGTARTATALVNSRSDISLLWLWTNHHKLSGLKHHKHSLPFSGDRKSERSFARSLLRVSQGCSQASSHSEFSSWVPFEAQPDCWQNPVSGQLVGICFPFAASCHLEIVPGSQRSLVFFALWSP